MHVYEQLAADEIYIEELLAQPRSARIELLSRPGGARCAEFQAAMNWEPHAVRGFLSTLRLSRAPAATRSIPSRPPSPAPR
jgi:hypothetical protein